jgi:hypothetical protein
MIQNTSYRIHAQGTLSLEQGADRVVNGRQTVVFAKCARFFHFFLRRGGASDGNGTLFVVSALYYATGSLSAKTTLSSHNMPVFWFVWRRRRP